MKNLMKVGLSISLRLDDLASREAKAHSYVSLFWVFTQLKKGLQMR